MDPYLERTWSDVHTSLMVHLRNQLGRQLPAGLQALVQEAVRIEGVAGGDSLRIAPDVSVIEREAWDSPAESETEGEGGVAIAEPVVIPAPAFTERNIEIIDIASGNRVVTAVEVLSPANKSSEAGKQRYLKKQVSYLESDTNLVEIDLLRSGDYVLAAPLTGALDGKRETYMASVFRARSNGFEVYPISLREPLPAFRVPLRAGDRDVIINLQAAIAAAYSDGQYRRYIDYSKPPVPRFDPEDAAWALGLVSG